MIRQLGKVVLLFALVTSTSGAIAATININTADAATLAQFIQGVGPRRAEAIVNYRTLHGPFKDVQELTKVKGIGQKLVNTNREKLVVSDSYSHLKDVSDKVIKFR